MWYTCACCNRVTEERQALLGRVSEVNLESLDQRSVWFLHWKCFVSFAPRWTHLCLLKSRTKLGEWTFKWKCCQMLYFSPEDNGSFVFTAVNCSLNGLLFGLQSKDTTYIHCHGIGLIHSSWSADLWVPNFQHWSLNSLTTVATECRENPFCMLFSNSLRKRSV